MDVWYPPCWLLRRPAYCITVHMSWLKSANIGWCSPRRNMAFLYKYGVVQMGSLVNAGISLGMCPANERRRYNVTTSRIGWAHTLTDLCWWPLGDVAVVIKFSNAIENNSSFVHCEIALRGMAKNITDEKSSLVQVMAWYLMAPSHWLSQCWPRSVLSLGDTGHIELNCKVDEKFEEFLWYLTVLRYTPGNEVHVL